jgi:hypothetical protein
MDARLPARRSGAFIPIKPHPGAQRIAEDRRDRDRTQVSISLLGLLRVRTQSRKLAQWRGCGSETRHLERRESNPSPA